MQDNNNSCSQLFLSELLQSVPFYLNYGISESVGGGNDKQSSSGSHKFSSQACYTLSLSDFRVSQRLLWLIHWILHTSHTGRFSFTTIYLQTEVCVFIFSVNIQNSGNCSLPPNTDLFSYVKFIYKGGSDIVRLCSLPLERWASGYVFIIDSFSLFLEISYTYITNYNRNYVPFPLLSLPISFPIYHIHLPTLYLPKSIYCCQYAHGCGLSIDA